MGGTANGNGGALRKLKITAVGDATVGKTSLLYTYTHHSFPEEYLPTIFENTEKIISVDGSMFGLTLWDTTGQEGYERLRSLSYPKTDCFLLCYAIDDPTTLTNVETKWIPELRHHCPKAAIILVGTNGDLRNEKSPEMCVSPMEAEEMKEKIGANAFVECSAKHQQNLDLAFEEAVRAVLLTKNGGNRRTCTIM